MSSTQHRCVFVGNIPYDAKEDQLIRICEEVGPVVSFRLVLDRETGKPKGYGFCEFRDEETASSARRNLQGYEINGRQLRVDFAENEKGSVDRTREQGRGGPGLAQTIDSHKPISVPVRDPAIIQPIGFGAAISAAAAMAGMLGASQMPATANQGDMGSNGQQNGGGAGGTAVGSDALTNHLAGMSRHQLYEIVSQMKDLIQQNQQQARQILIANPQLTKALFQAQIMLGMVRPPQTSPLQNVAVQPSQQQPAQQSQMQPVQVPLVQPPQVQNMPQLPATQTTVQQGQPQMPTGQLQNQLPQPVNLLQPHQSSQNVPFQPSVQSTQQSNARTSTMLPSMLPSSQSVQLPGLQPHNPAIQHAQPQPPSHVHPPPLPQQPRPLPPAQLPHQNAQNISFQLPPGPHSHLPQPPFQQPSGILQTSMGRFPSSMGLPYQTMHPPLPNQPLPPQVFQMSRSGADLGNTGIPQSGLPNNVSMGLDAISQGGRGPSMGVPSGPAPNMPWNQPLPSSGSMGGAPQGTTSMGMAVHMGPGPLLGSGNGIGSALAGGLSSNGAQPGVIRSNVTGEGPGMIYSQGYSQPLLQPPPQQQSQQVSLELEQQKALLQQVMNLTPEQINLLPPNQRQQVLELQQAFRNQS